MDPEFINALTIIAAFSQAGALIITFLIFYKNLLVLRKTNKLTIERFTFQSEVEKYSLSLKFADWIKSELSDWLPYVLGDIKHEYLSKNEIKEHFDNIAINMIRLIQKEIVFKSLMLDEIKKMLSVLETIDNDDENVALLRLLLKRSP